MVPKQRRPQKDPGCRRAAHYPVPVLDCDGCGACCMAQCSPPGYVIFAKPPPWIDEIPDDDFDCRTYDSAPAEAKAAMQEYVDGLNDQWNHDDVPCCWFDLKTLRCRWYEWRPLICREFEIGSEGCRSWRDDCRFLGGTRAMILQETAGRIWNCYREIGAAVAFRKCVPCDPSP